MEIYQTAEWKATGVLFADVLKFSPKNQCSKVYVEHYDCLHNNVDPKDWGAPRLCKLNNKSCLIVKLSRKSDVPLHTLGLVV